MNGKIVPSRITEAREARAMSMGELADAINITRQSVSKYERGIIKPAPEVLQAISLVLDFPFDFFYKKESLANARSSSLFFRSNSGITKKLKTACSYQVKWVNEIREQLAEYVNFIDHEIPTIDTNYEDLSFEDIEELALSVREAWGMKDEPVKDLIGILENKGVILSQFAVNDFCEFKGIDAFSSWRNGVPYILYHSTQKSAVRTRFSILHELGHLIMHSSVSEEDAVKKGIIDFADQQADRFAAAFLLPATSFPNDVHGSSLSSFEAIKLKWEVSLSAIIKRCENLGILSENQIGYLKKQMTMKKYWRSEPFDNIIEIEPPEMLKNAVMLLVDRNIISKTFFLEKAAYSAKDLVKICSLPEDYFDEYKQRQKPFLRLVHSENICKENVGF